MKRPSNENLSGQTFGKLKVLAKVQYGYVCKCQCGEEITVRGAALVDEKVSACPACVEKSPDVFVSKKNLIYNAVMRGGGLEFKKYCGIRFIFGRHKGKTLAWVLYHDPQYLQWVARNSDPSKMTNKDIHNGFVLFGKYADAVFALDYKYAGISTGQVAQELN